MKKSMPKQFVATSTNYKLHFFYYVVYKVLRVCLQITPYKAYLTIILSFFS